MVPGTPAIFYERGGKTIKIADAETEQLTRLDHSEEIEQIIQLGKDEWLIKEKSGGMCLLKKEAETWSTLKVSAPDELQIQAVRSDQTGNAYLNADGYYFVKGTQPGVSVWISF